MRAAVIDLGTNTFHLLIAEITGSAFEVLYKTTVAVKLGEGRINENIIIPTAFERGINTLKNFNQTIQNYEIDRVRATATSAVRSAINGNEFVAAVKDQANIAIEIITGEEEADLIYQGVKLSGAIKDISLIIDIGGGSIEFILCDLDKLIWKQSYNIGAARLMQQFLRSDPISDEDKNAILRHIQNELEELFEVCSLHKPQVLIGSAGAFETFAALIIGEDNDATKISKLKIYPFVYEEYINTSIKLFSASRQERKSMPGMIPLRVDMIVIAALITNYVLGRTKINRVILSTYDLKMGILSNLLH